jgi:hypothetical protein
MPLMMRSWYGFQREAPTPLRGSPFRPPALPEVPDSAKNGKDLRVSSSEITELSLRSLILCGVIDFVFSFSSG